MIYTRSGFSWQYQARLTQDITDSYEGYSVALSANSDVPAAGAPYSSFFIKKPGATQIYTRSGSIWNHQATLSQNVTGSDEGY